MTGCNPRSPQTEKKTNAIYYLIFISNYIINNNATRKLLFYNAIQGYKLEDVLKDNALHCNQRFWRIYYEHASSGEQGSSILSSLNYSKNTRISLRVAHFPMHKMYRSNVHNTLGVEKNKWLIYLFSKRYAIFFFFFSSTEIKNIH